MSTCKICFDDGTMWARADSGKFVEQPCTCQIQSQPSSTILSKATPPQDKGPDLNTLPWLTSTGVRRITGQLLEDNLTAPFIYMASYNGHPFLVASYCHLDSGSPLKINSFNHARIERQVALSEFSDTSNSDRYRMRRYPNEKPDIGPHETVIWSGTDQKPGFCRVGQLEDGDWWCYLPPITWSE